MARLTIVIDSDLGEVSLVAVAVNSICRYVGLDEIEANGVELCVAEASTNAIRHAYDGKRGHAVSIEVSTQPGMLHLVISDTGTTMSEEHVLRLIKGAGGDGLDPADIDSIAEGGRGLQIMHDLMDEVSYVRDGNLNCLHLRKRTPRHS